MFVKSRKETIIALNLWSSDFYSEFLLPNSFDWLEGPDEQTEN